MSKPLHTLYFSLAVLLLIAAPAYSVPGNTPSSGDKATEQYYTGMDALSEDNPPAPYYEDAKRGWYWYEQYLEKVKKEEEKKEKEKKETVKKHRLPDLKDYPIEKLWDMHPDDFQELLMDFQKKAVMRPSEGNVADYYYIQDVARRKSLAFANVAATVIQKRPDLNLEKDYPTAQPGRQALTRQRRNEIVKGIEEARNNFGLIYFYSPTCEYCMEESKILAYFEKRYGWEIKKVNITEEPELAQLFSVDIVPHIVMVYDKSLDPITISSGVIALDDMEDKIYRSARLLRGEITPEEYSIYEFQRGGGFDVKTHPYRENPQINLKGGK